MATVTYTIPNISCGHCTRTIETEVGEIEGVKEVKADIDRQQATITFVPPATEDRIKALLEEINYPPVPTVN